MLLLLLLLRLQLLGDVLITAAQAACQVPQAADRRSTQLLLLCTTLPTILPLCSC
jgi:hypothetical protein